MASQREQPADGASRLRLRAILLWTIASVILGEAVMLYLRFRAGLSATEFNKTAPLLLQIHHMFWSIPFLLAVPMVWRKPRLSGALLGIAIGLVIGDLLHHFAILPLLVGNTGWHWP